ncbi:MAG: hypothetical protein ACLFTR_04420 [Candidatus Woesearchaeota archaeon]
MTLLNLSEKYKKESNPDLFERMKMHFDLDTYYATTFYDIENGFDADPPKKRDSWSSSLSAYILMYEVALQKHELAPFDEEDPDSLKLIDKGKNYPCLLLDDGVLQRLAYWMCGDSYDFSEHVERYNISYDSYSKIPKIMLQYIHADAGGWLTIRSLDFDDSLQEDRKTTLEEKIGKFIERIFDDRGPAHSPV